MSSFIFSASPFESSENENNGNYLERKKKKNVTFKKQPSSKVSSLKLFDNNDEDQDLADFNPPKPPELTTMNNNENDKMDYSANDKTTLNTRDYPYNNENTILPDSYDIPNSYNSAPKLDNNTLSNHELNEKITHIIHLLEESHNEKTSNITEELILYSFLGVFIIFIVDSFTKSGKYTR